MPLLGFNIQFYVQKIIIIHMKTNKVQMAGVTASLLYSCFAYMYVSVCNVCAWCPQRAEEDISSLYLIIDSYELSCGY